MAVTALLLAPSPAAAQLSRPGVSKQIIPGALLFNDIAHDSRNDVYLSVVSWGTLWYAFVNASGDVISSGVIPGPNPANAFANNPRVAYSPELNAGQGGFLVTWHQNAEVHSAVVSYPAGVIVVDPGGAAITAGNPSVANAGGPSIAYSPDTHKLLVTWTSAIGAWGVQGRIINAATGVPEGSVLTLVQPTGARDPAAAWNSSTQEFGVGYAGFSASAAYMGLVRVNAAGTVSPPAGPFGQSSGTFNTSIAVNAAGHYVLAWAAPGGARSLELDASGTPLAAVPALISSRIGTPTSFAMALNPISGTLLAISEDAAGSTEVPGVELNSTGIPLASPMLLTDGAIGGGAAGSYAPRVTARATAKNWSISYSRYRGGYELANQIVATASTDAPLGPPPPPPLTVQALTSSPASGFSEGNSITFTANATGGTGPYTYQFWQYTPATGWVIAQPYGTTKTYTLSAPPAGTYAIQVWVRNAGSTATQDGWSGTGLFSVAAPRATITAFNVDQSFPLAINIPTNWSALATTPGGAVEYKFWRYSASTGWEVAQDWSATPSYTWFPLAGAHAVQVWARRVGSTAQYEDWRSSGFFTISSSPAHVVSLTSNIGVPASPTAPITWTAAGSGGTGFLEYKYWLYTSASNTWTVLRDWSRNSQATWTPGLANTGQNAVQVWVRTEGNPASYEDWTGTGLFTVSLSTGLTLTSTPLTGLRVTSPVTFTGQMLGGGGPYEYQFWVFNGTSWSIAQAYGTSTSFVWSTLAPGTYALQVWARAVGSSAPWERWAGTGFFVVNP